MNRFGHDVAEMAVGGAGIDVAAGEAFGDAVVAFEVVDRLAVAGVTQGLEPVIGDRGAAVEAHAGGTDQRVAEGQAGQVGEVVDHGGSVLLWWRGRGCSKSSVAEVAWAFQCERHDGRRHG